MATTIDNVVLVFTARGVSRVTKSINEVGFSASRASKGVGLLGASLGGLGAALAVRSVAAYADTFTELQNRLRLVTNSSEEVAVATQNIFDIASKTRANIEETSRTYFRFARANERLGLSEQELLDITTVVNQAVAFSGTTADSAASALFQFSQGIAAGTLRGQELNSVLEQIPGLAETLAKGLGVGVDQLRALGEAGQLTGKALAQALLSQREFAGEQFGRVVFTVSQEFEGLRTEIIRYVGELDKSLGVSRAVAKGIRFLALNLETAGKVAAVAGGLIFRSLAVTAVKGVAVLSAALVANPFGAIIAAAGLAVSAVVAFREDITIAAAGGATAATALEVAFGKIKSAAVDGFEKAKMAISDFRNSFAGEATAGAFNRFGQSLTDSLNNSTGIIRQWANIAIGLFTLPFRVLINSFQRLPRAIGDLFFQALEGLRQIIIGQFNWEQFVENITNFLINSFKKAFTFVIEAGKAAFNALKDLSFSIDFDKIISEVDQGFDKLKNGLGTQVANPFEGAAEEFANGFFNVLDETFNRDFVGDVGGIIEKLKIEVIKPFLEDVKKAQAAKDALGKEAPLRAPTTERPTIEDGLDAQTASKIKQITDRFTDQTIKLREQITFLREYRDQVAALTPEQSKLFDITVEQVDRAINEIENRIAGTTDLFTEMWTGAAEASRNAIVDVLLDPLNASFKDIVRGFVETMQRIVAEAIAAEAVLAALNFFQGFISTPIPGATAAPRPAGSALGGDIIGGQPRLVGERGPEIIVPSQRSTVIPNSALRGSGGSNAKLESMLSQLISVTENKNLSVVNVNEQDPEAQLAIMETKRGAQVQRNRITADRRQISRTLGVRP